MKSAGNSHALISPKRTIRKQAQRPIFYKLIPYLHEVRLHLGWQFWARNISVKFVSLTYPWQNNLHSSFANGKRTPDERNTDVGGSGCGGRNFRKLVTHPRSPSRSSCRPAYFCFAHTALHPITAVLLYQDDLAHWAVHGITTCNHSLKNERQKSWESLVSQADKTKRKLIPSNSLLDEIQVDGGGPVETEVLLRLLQFFSFPSEKEQLPKAFANWK